MTNSSGGGGYGDPPKHTQFQKGASGNPRGRPRGSRGLKADLKTVLHEHVTHPETGKRVRRREMVVRALAAKAVRGNVSAADKILALEIQAFGFEEAQKAAPTLSENDALILAQFMGQSTMAVTDESDLPDPEPQPSPQSDDDDVDPDADTHEEE
jgi:hypothetical protein